MSAVQVSYPVAGQSGPAHMMVAGFQELVEICKRDRLGIYRNFFLHILRANAKVTRSF